MKHNYVLKSFFALCIKLHKIILKKAHEILKLWTDRLAQNQPKWYRYIWTRISVEPIGAYARTILLTFTMTIACSSWITWNYNQIDITEHCPLNLEGSKVIRTWYILQKMLPKILRMFQPIKLFIAKYCCVYQIIENYQL